MWSLPMFELPSKLQVYELLVHSLQDMEHLEDVELVPMNPFIFDTARQNDKRGAKMAFIVPDDWVKNVRGLKEFQDVFVMVRVPREVLMDHIERKTNEQREVSGSQPDQENPEEIHVSDTPDKDSPST